MIVVDSSARLAVALGEPDAAACMAVLTCEPEMAMSAGTAADSFIAALRRGGTAELDRLITGLGIEIVASAWRSSPSSIQIERHQLFVVEVPAHSE